MRKLLTGILTLLLGSVSAVSTQAQTVPGYLTDKGDAAVRVEIVGVPAPLPPQTVWQRFQALISIRRQQPYRPEVGTVFTVQSSAYASSPYQTDSTPCITAVGTRVRPGVVASNFLPIGTVLDVNGEKYIVEDRMNPRYDGYFIDIWFPSTSDALEFGRRSLTVTVIGYDEPGAAIRAEEVIEEPAVEESFLERVQLTFANLASLLGARGPDVNRFDVDCLSQETGE